MTAHFVDLLDELRRRSLRMASLVEDVVGEALEALAQQGEALARRVIARDEDVDAKEVKVESEVIRLLALYQPVGSDLRLLCTVLKVNNDLERVADCAVNIAERALHLDPSQVTAFGEEFQRLGPIVQRMLRHAVQAYASQNPEEAGRVLLEEESVDALYGQLIRTAVGHDMSIAPLLDLLSVAKNLERIADHATNIAEDVIFLATGEIVRHRPV